MADLDTSNIFFYPAKPGQNGIQSMHSHLVEEPGGRLFAMEEKWKLIYNENQRSPNYAVSHYITYLRRYVDTTDQLRAIVSGKTTEKFSRKGLYDRAETRSSFKDTQKSLDSISPMSYFIRKLKLDLKLAFVGFVEEFCQAPNNGQRLLLHLLKNLQFLAASPGGGLFTKGGTRGTLTMEEYKQNMIDGQDCLLCIKYTLRAKKASEELLNNNGGLLTVTLCVLSNFSRSRITALEILTLLLAGPSAVDRVLEAFTSVRIIHAESCRFKMLVNMLYTRGVSQVLFQVTCLRLLNTILNLCKTANMRVYLQCEMEEAGLDVKRIQQNTTGDGLEFDDLRKEIWEWKMRYVDVDAILRKIKADLKVDAPGSALTEFNYDQHFGRFVGFSSSGIDSPNRTMVEDGPYTQPVSQRKEKWISQNSKVNGGGRSKKNTNFFQRPSSVISSHPESSARNSAKGVELSAHSGKVPDIEILSRAASPTNPRPTQALSGAEENRAVGLGGFVSIKAELWEPYGMVINNEPVRETQDTTTGTVELVHDTENWVMTASPSSHLQSEKNKDKQSNLSLVSGDGKEQLNIRQNTEHDTSKLFFSPKNSGIDVGPLKWFNPGITLPDSSPKTRAEFVSEQGSERAKISPSRYNNNPQTPSPDYTCTPPPDYNDSDIDEHHEKNCYRPRKSSVPPMSPELETKARSNDTDNHQKDSTPFSMSTLKSNFERWPAVWRKSFSEVSLSTPNEIATDTIELSPEKYYSSPQLPPPRVVYSSDVKTSLSSFPSGHTLETTRAVPKRNNNNFYRHTESKHVIEGQWHSADPDDKTKPESTIKTGKKCSSKQSLLNYLAKQNIPTADKNSNKDSAPGIPFKRSPKLARTSKDENQPISQTQQNLLTSQTKPQHSKPPSGDSDPTYSSKSTIIITSRETSIRHNHKDTTTCSNSREDGRIGQRDDTHLKYDRNAVLEKTKSPLCDIKVPTAITITSPTPPQTMSSIHEAISSENSSTVKHEHEKTNPFNSYRSDIPLNHTPQQGVISTEAHSKTITGYVDTSLNKTSVKVDKNIRSEHDSKKGEGENSTPHGPVIHNRQDSALSYTSEIGRVLGELDHTLETHGWQASLKQQVKKPRPPLVAYV